VSVLGSQEVVCDVVVVRSEMEIGGGVMWVSLRWKAEVVEQVFRFVVEGGDVGGS